MLQETLIEANGPVIPEKNLHFFEKKKAAKRKMKDKREKYFLKRKSTTRDEMEV